MDSATYVYKTINMEFNKVVLEKIQEPLSLYGLKLDEDWPGMLQFVSEKAVISIAYDDREYNYPVAIGPDREHQYALRHEVMEVFFGSDYSEGYTFPVKSAEDFAYNLLILFERFGHSLFIDNIKFMDYIRTFTYRDAHMYTENLLQRQYLRDADSAWENKNYVGFVRAVSHLNRPLSKVIRKKLEMAMKKANLDSFFG